MSSRSSSPHNIRTALPIPNASKRISSHTLAAVTCKCMHHPKITALQSLMVNQITQQPALCAVKLETDKAAEKLS